MAGIFGTRSLELTDALGYALPHGQQASAALAQLVEHRIRNAGVVGSNPIGGTVYSDVFSLKSGGVIGHVIHSVMSVFIPWKSV